MAEKDNDATTVTILLDGKQDVGLKEAEMMSDGQDEDHTEEKRHSWGSKREYVLSALGYSVGIGNIWRFPYLCKRNGGGAFLIPFVLSVLLIGIPLYFLETVLGQFTCRSPLHVWGFCPIIKGVGVSISILATIVFWYYSVLMGWAVFYFVSSFSSTLPWTRCDGWWNTPQCRNSTRFTEEGATLSSNISVFLSTNVSTVSSPAPADMTNTSRPSSLELEAAWNLTGQGNSMSDLSSTKLVSAAEEFWQHHVLQVSSGLYEVGHVVWYLALAQVFVFLFVFFALIKGIKTSGKVVYVTATAPYVLMIVLLIRGATLPGAVDGLLYYITPDFGRLQDPQVWVEAAIQVFYSLGPGWGPTITLASYNKFHNNCLRDSTILALAGEGTSILGGFTIFAVLGYMSFESGIPINEVVSSGPGLAFIVYPEAISLMPLPQLWAVLFFFMVFTAVVDTQLACGESVMTVLCDQYPRFLGRQRKLLTGSVTVFLLVLSLILVTQSGVYWFQLIDWFIATYTLTVVAILELVAVGWIYGADRIGEDIEMMIGRKPPMIFKILWCFLTPAILVMLLVFTLTSYEPPTYGDYHYGTGAVVIGWMIATVSFLPIPVLPLMLLYRGKGTLIQRLKKIISPDHTWGPSDPDRRQLYRQHLMKREPRQSWLDILRN